MPVKRILSFSQIDLLSVQHVCHRLWPIAQWRLQMWKNIRIPQKTYFFCFFFLRGSVAGFGYWFSDIKNEIFSYFKKRPTSYIFFLDIMKLFQILVGSRIFSKFTQWLVALFGFIKSTQTQKCVSFLNNCLGFGFKLNQL